jgi:hypothetical protein
MKEFLKIVSIIVLIFTPIFIFYRLLPWDEKGGGIYKALEVTLNTSNRNPCFYINKKDEDMDDLFFMDIIINYRPDLNFNPWYLEEYDYQKKQYSKLIPISELVGIENKICYGVLDKNMHYVPTTLAYNTAYEVMLTAGNKEIDDENIFYYYKAYFRLKKDLDGKTYIQKITIQELDSEWRNTSEINNTQ